MFSLHEPLPRETRDALGAYDDLTAALLARRGIVTSEAAAAFLSPSYDEHLHDPLLMHDMQKAAERVAHALTTGEKITVWSDYDCDGIPGAVLLHDFFTRVGAQFDIYIPHRHAEGYGLSETGITALAESGTKLLITVDSGITDTDAVAHASTLGIDTIVTDHHLPGPVLPSAYAVINPNARADEPYPFHGLCGTGVAWKLACAILAVSPSARERVPLGGEKWLLDMVGLATIADMVPLTGENRVLAAYGQLVLRKSPRIGFQKLCRAMRLDQRALDEDDIGFMVAPRINAASRLGNPTDAFRLLATADETEADMLAKELEKLNRERKARAGAITRAVRARLAERAHLPSVIAIGDPDWRPALLGLVANTIADEYERPVFLWGREGNGALKGSVRSGGFSHALELMQAADDVFVTYGGHAASGGFTVKDDKIFVLEESLARAEDARETKAEVESAPRADARLALADVSPRTLRSLEQLAPFGMENPRPLFLFDEAYAREVSRFGKGNEHLKIILTDKDGRNPTEAISFFARGKLARLCENAAPGTRMSALAHIEKNMFSRARPVRLRLVDLALV
jgi:single-stranded-DNA-specific exonuclease